MFQKSLAAGLIMLAGSPLLAAPADYQDALPADVLGMTVREAKMDGDRLIAFYGETVGRATVTIAPAPDADPKGEHDGADAPEGQTPAAQLVLMHQLGQNLSRGTKALGDGYATAPIRVDGLEVDDRKAICATIERSQAEDQITEGKEQMFLLDRVCTAQIGEDIASVYVTPP